MPASGASRRANRSPPPAFQCVTRRITAGGGILHIETPPEHLVASGGLFHGFQLWVNLPAALKWSPPRYQDIRASEVSLLSSPDGGALVRVIAGEVAGHGGPGV